MPLALKLTYRGVCRKLVFTDATQLTWDAMEHNVRTLFHLDTPFSLQYEDDDGEMITCSSTFELREVIPLLDAQGRRAFGLNVVPLDVRSQATYHRIHHYLNEVSDGPLGQDSLASMDSGVELQVPQRLKGRRPVQKPLDKTSHTAGGGAPVLGTSPSDPVRWPAAGARVVPSGVERRPRRKPPKTSVSVPTLPTHWNLPPSVYSSLFESSLYPVKRQEAQQRNESRVSTGLKSVVSGHHPSQAPPLDLSRTRSQSHLQVPGSLRGAPLAVLNLLPEELTDIPPMEMPTEHSYSHSQALPNRSAEAASKNASMAHHPSIKSQTKSPGPQNSQSNVNPQTSQIKEPSTASKDFADLSRLSLPQLSAHRSRPSRHSASNADHLNSVVKSTTSPEATSARISTHASHASLAPPSPRPAASRSQASSMASPKPLPQQHSHHSSHHASVAADPAPQGQASPPPLPPVPAHLTPQVSQHSAYTGSGMSTKPAVVTSRANSQAGGGETVVRSHIKAPISPQAKSAVVEPVPQCANPAISANLVGSVAQNAVTDASMASAPGPMADAHQASLLKSVYQPTAPSVNAEKPHITGPSTPIPEVVGSGLSRQGTHQALTPAHSAARVPSIRKSASLAKSCSVAKGDPLVEPEYDTTELIPPRLQGSISHLALVPPTGTAAVAESPQSPGELSKVSSTDTASPRLTASLLNISEHSEDAAKSLAQLSVRHARQASAVSVHSARRTSAAASFVATAKSLHRLSPQRTSVIHHASTQGRSQHPSTAASPQLASHVADAQSSSPSAPHQSSPGNGSNAQSPTGSMAASLRPAASKHASMHDSSVHPLVGGDSLPKSPLPSDSPVAATTSIRSGSRKASRQPSQVVVSEGQGPVGTVAQSQGASPGLSACTSGHQTPLPSKLVKETSIHRSSQQPSMVALSQHGSPSPSALPVDDAATTKLMSPTGSRLPGQVTPQGVISSPGSAAVAHSPQSPPAANHQSVASMHTSAHDPSPHTSVALGSQQPTALSMAPSAASSMATQPTSPAVSHQPNQARLSNSQLPPAGTASIHSSAPIPSGAAEPQPTSPTPRDSPVPVMAPIKPAGTPALSRQPSQTPLETAQPPTVLATASPAPTSPVAIPKSQVSQHSLMAKDTSAVHASRHSSVVASPSHASPAATKSVSSAVSRQPSRVHASVAPSPTSKSPHSASVLSPETEARSSSHESSIESVVPAVAPALSSTGKQSHASATSHPGATSRVSLQPSIVISPPTPDPPAEQPTGTHSASQIISQSAKQSENASLRSSAHALPETGSSSISQAEPCLEVPQQQSQVTSSGADEQQVALSLQASHASPSLPPAASHQASVADAASPIQTPVPSGQRSRVSVTHTPTSPSAMSRQPSVVSVTGTVAPIDASLPPPSDSKPVSLASHSPNADLPPATDARPLEPLADKSMAQQPSGVLPPSVSKPATPAEIVQSKGTSVVRQPTPSAGPASHVDTSPSSPAASSRASVVADVKEALRVPSAVHLANTGAQSPKNTATPLSRESPYASQLAAARSRVSLNRSQVSPKGTRPGSQHPLIVAAGESAAASSPPSALASPKSAYVSPELSPAQVPSSVEPTATLAAGNTPAAEPTSNVTGTVHDHLSTQHESPASMVKDEGSALPADAPPLRSSLAKSRSQLGDPAAPLLHASRSMMEVVAEPAVVADQLASPAQAPASPSVQATSTLHSKQASMARSHVPSPQRSSLRGSQLLATAAAQDGGKAASVGHEAVQPAGSAATSPHRSRLPTSATRSPSIAAHATASPPSQGSMDGKGVSTAPGDDPAARPVLSHTSVTASPSSRPTMMSVEGASGIKSPAPQPPGQLSLEPPVAADSETPNTIENRSTAGPTEAAALSANALAEKTSSHQLPAETGAQSIAVNPELSGQCVESSPVPASMSPSLPPSQLPPPNMLSKSIEAIRAIGSTSQQAHSQSVSKVTQTLAPATASPEPPVANSTHSASHPPSNHNGPISPPKPENTSNADNSRMARTSTAERIQQIRRPSISQLLERQASGKASPQRSRAASLMEPAPAQPSHTGALEPRSPEKMATPSPQAESPRMIESPIWEPENNEKKITPKAAPLPGNVSHPSVVEASVTSMSASQLEDQEQKLQELRSVLVNLSKSLAHLHSKVPSHPALTQLGSAAAIAEIDKQLEAVHQEQKQQFEVPPQASPTSHRTGSHLAPEAAQGHPASYHSANVPSGSADVLSEDASVHTMTPVGSPKLRVGPASASVARPASLAAVVSQPSLKQGGEPNAVTLPKAGQSSHPSLPSVSRADQEVEELARVLSDPHAAAVPPAAALSPLPNSQVAASNHSSPHTVTPIRNSSRHSSPPAVARIPTRPGSPLPTDIGGEGTSPIRQSSPDPQGRGANDSFFTGSLGSSLLHSPLDASAHPSGNTSPRHSNPVALDPQVVDAALASKIEPSPGVDMTEEQRRLDALTEAVTTSAAALATVAAVASAVKTGNLSVAQLQDPSPMPPSPNLSHVAKIPLPLSRSLSTLQPPDLQMTVPKAVVDLALEPAPHASTKISFTAQTPLAESPRGAPQGSSPPSKVASTVRSRVASFEAKSQAPAAAFSSTVPGRTSSRSSSGQSTFDRATNFPLPPSAATFVGQATSAALGTSQRSNLLSPHSRPVQASGNHQPSPAANCELSVIAPSIREAENHVDIVDVPQIVDEMVDQLRDVTGVLNSLMDGHPDLMEPITDVIRLVQGTMLNSIDHVARSLVSQRSTRPLGAPNPATLPPGSEIAVVTESASIKPAAQGTAVAASTNDALNRSENPTSREPSPVSTPSLKPSPALARASQRPEAAGKLAERSDVANAKSALQPSRPPSPRPMTAPPMANDAGLDTSATSSSMASTQHSPKTSAVAAPSHLSATMKRAPSPHRSAHVSPNASIAAPSSPADAQPQPGHVPLPTRTTISPQKSGDISGVSFNEKGAAKPSSAPPDEAKAEPAIQPVEARGPHSPTIPLTKISSVSESYTPSAAADRVGALPAPMSATSKGEPIVEPTTQAPAPQSPPAQPVKTPIAASTRLTPTGRRTPQPYQRSGASMQSKHDTRASGAPPPPSPPPDNQGAQPLNASMSSAYSGDHGSLPSLQSDSSSIASYDPQVEPSTPSPLLPERLPTDECSDHPSIAVPISGDPSGAEGIPVGFTPGDAGPPGGGGHHSFYHHHSGSGLWQDSVHGSYHYYRTFSERYPGYQQQYSYSQHQHTHHRTAGAPPYGQGGGKSPPTSAPTTTPGFPTMANRGGHFPTNFACCPLGQPQASEHQAGMDHGTSNARFTTNVAHDATGFRFSHGRGGRWEHAPATASLPSRQPRDTSRPPKSAGATDIIDIPVIHYSANSPKDFRVDEAVSDELHRGTQKILDLGFRDYRTVHRVLKQSGGEVEVAIQRLRFMQTHPL
ncbi:hypothetical protein H4R35_001324 [Dimargaris xerosporica]|nr:hypothetical protein H4R35_001324 [Dimargaris xerosporica]